MSDRMTSVRLPGCGDSGFAEWGLKTPAEMIIVIRAEAARVKAWAEEVLAARDGDFEVETFLGIHARRNGKTLQKGRGQ